MESYLSVIYNNTEQQPHHQSVKLLCSFFAVQVQLSSRYLGKKPSIMAACIVTLAVDLFNANEKCFKSLTSDELSRTLNDDLMETLKHGSTICVVLMFLPFGIKSGTMCNTIAKFWKENPHE